ncbi:MAG: PKD domain-containing protein [Victivallales bacterium]
MSKQLLTALLIKLYFKPTGNPPRRTVLHLPLLASLLLSVAFTCASVGATTINCDVSAEVHPVSPYIYGSNLTSGDPQWNKDVLSSQDMANAKMMRYYPKAHWTDPSLQNIDYFLKFCEQIGTAPSLVPTLTTDTAKEAAAWVAYCNGNPANTQVIGVDENGYDWQTVGYWAGKRANGGLDGSCGHPAPYNVLYWEMGNELYANSQIGGAAGYVARVNSYSAAMKAVDPNIKIGAGLVDATTCWKTGGYDQWNKTVLTDSKDYIDFAMIRPYGYKMIYADGSTHMMAQMIYPYFWAEKYASVEYIRNLITQYAPGKSISISATEYGLDCAATVLPYLYSGIGVAEMAGVSAKHGMHASLLWKMFDPVYGAKDSPAKDAVRNPAYHALDLVGNHSGSTYIQTTVADSPIFHLNPVIASWNWGGNVGNVFAGDYPLLTAYATKSTDGNTVYILVINKSMTHGDIACAQDISANIALSGFTPGQNSTAWTLNGSDIISDNKRQENVCIKKRVFATTGSTFSYTFPAHSATVLEIRSSASSMPIAVANSSTKISRVGKSISFDGSASMASSGATVASYAWAFGDGATSSQKTVNYAYATPGFYDVVLTVSDSEGKISKDTLRIEVRMLENASFEDDADHNTIADGWAITGVSMKTLSSDAKEGSRSQQFQTTGYGNGLSQEWISVLPSTTYTLSAWVKVVQGQVSMHDYETNDSWQVIGTKGSKFIGPSDWTYHSITFTTAPNATKASVRFFGWTSGTTLAYVDDVSFTRCNVQNPSFEIWSNNIPQNWQVQTGTATPSNDAKDGVYSIKYSANRQNYAGLVQEWIKVKPFTSYVLSAWVKVEQGHLEILDGECTSNWGRFIGSRAYKKIGVSGWTRHMIPFTTDKNCTLLSVRLFGGLSESTVAYIDDVKLEEGMISNSSFEVDVGNDGIADGWPVMGTPQCSRSSDAVEGSYSQLFQAQGINVDGIASNVFGVRPNTTYEMTFYAKVSSGALGVWDGETGSSGNWLGSCFYEEIGASNWSRHYITFTTNPKAQHLNLRFTGAADGTVALIDNVTIEMTGAISLIAHAGDDQTVSRDQPVAFDASHSYSSNTITSYAWDFGDGTKGTGVSASHIYTNGGTYPVALCVTDNLGHKSFDTVNITVDYPLIVNAGADKTVHVSDIVTFDGSGTTDSGGNIVSYAWDFADGTQGSGAKPTHAYAGPGKYTAKLTVTDDNGHSGFDTVIVTVQAYAFVANAGVDQTAKVGTSMTLDGSKSYDGVPGHTIASYTWDFGDGTPDGSGSIVTHTYNSVGTYTAKLTVVNSVGATATDTASIKVRALTADAGPDRSAAPGDIVAFDGSNSFGGIVSYTWNFGDGTTATGVKPTHSYASPKTYTVTLTVQDAGGGIATDTLSMLVNPVRNYSFEIDADNNNIADNWAITGASMKTLSSDAKEGSRSQQFQTTGYGNGLRQEWIIVQPSTTYTLSAWVKVTQGQLCMHDYETNNSWQAIGTKGSKLIGSSDWTYHTITFTTAPNATKVSVRFFGWINGTTAAYVDSVKLEFLSGAGNSPAQVKSAAASITANRAPTASTQSMAANGAPFVTVTASTYEIDLSQAKQVTVTATAIGMDKKPLAYSWSKVSGPGSAKFAVPNAKSSEVSFLTSGTYVLKVKVSDGKLSSSGLVEIKVGDEGLVAWYDFENIGSSTVPDVSGNALNGTISGGVIPNAAGVRGGKALEFNGMSGMVTVADNAALDLTTEMTLEAWVCPAGQMDLGSTVLVKDDGADSSVYCLYANEDSKLPVIGARTDSEYQVATGTVQLMANRWTHLAGTYDGQNIRLYVDGELVATEAQSGSIPVSGGPLRIGGNALLGEYFGGLMDEVRVYSRVLSAEEIADVADQAN